MEYWAVVWGTVIMGATGFILWFENFFLKFVGTTGMDISTTIHYYEAILASLAILVWHFYFIFLNPDVYPMNKAWSKGYLTRHQMENEHPLELEQIDAALKGEETQLTDSDIGNTKPDVKAETGKNENEETKPADIKDAQINDSKAEDIKKENPVKTDSKPSRKKDN
jgi:hypothetical protein